VKPHVTLVNPPYPKGAPQSIFIPLGIAYLAAVLEKEGYSVNIIDCQVLKPTRRELESELIKYQPHVVGVTTSTLTYEPAVQIIMIAKEVLPDCVALLGGPHVTVMDKETLDEVPQVDVVVRSEGEQTILELAEAVSNSHMKGLNEIAGITFRKDGQVVHTRDRPFIQNLDQLPFPAYKHFPLNKFRVFGKTYLPIITSRGCPFQCAFCLASRMCGKKFRARTPKNVVDELEWLRDTHGADAFAFYDDTFTFDETRARKICEELKYRDIDVPWDCRTRVDRISKELLVEMRSANCQLIHFGVESGSQKMLDVMKKGATVEQNEKAITWAKEAGISVAISVVLGYPGETPDMLKQTFDFIGKTEPDYVYVCVAIPYPGTELYNLLKELGWKMSFEWNHYDEQTHVFKNPLLSSETIAETRNTFYNHFLSPSYVLRQSLKGTFYSRIMARTALNHLLWRTKLPRMVFGSFRKLTSGHQED
jgi:anaerobic magnesium-protoporphyrin IX monomethyl ester cyclase